MQFQIVPRAHSGRLVPEKQRFYAEEVACFVEQLLMLHTPEEQAKWAHLPAQLRAHRFPFFLVTPSTRIVDCAKRVSEAPGTSETDPNTYIIEN
jgi:hypothetical protein